MSFAGKKRRVSFLSCSVFGTPSKTVKPKPPNVCFPLLGSEYDMISGAPKMDDNWGLTPTHEVFQILLDDKNKVVYESGRETGKSEEQDENKKMKSIVVEEQEQEEGSESESESETGFVDLDQDTLHNVLKRVDMVTLGRAACVNKLWCEVARDNRLWDPIFMRIWASNGCHWLIDGYGNWSSFSEFLHIRRITPYLRVIDSSPPDFPSIDFSSQIGPFV